MSGVNVVVYLLTHNTNLVAQVPAAHIKAGILPQGTTMPAIGVAEITGSSRNIVAMNATSKMITERVQVTVLAEDYPTKKTILNLVRKALPQTRGAVDSITVDSVLDDTEGPDIDDPLQGIYIQTQDFIVKFSR